MSQIVPLIRAAASMSIVRWLLENHRPVEDVLRAAGLAFMPLEDASATIPILNVAALFRDMARREGPDIGARMVSRASLPELGMLGRVALAARSPHEGLRRVASVLQSHATHETIIVNQTAAGLEVRDVWTLSFDDEALHQIQLFVAALIVEYCRLTGARGQIVKRLEILPHPEAGLDHLRPNFGAAVVAAPTHAMVLTIAAEVADRVFPASVRAGVPGLSDPVLPDLRGDGTLTDSVRRIIAVMLRDEPPSLDRLAAAAGMSPRTFQRRLGEEGHSFSELLDEARRTAALDCIAAGRETLTRLAADVGYARQSGLSRAVRRWTGAAPSHLARTLADGGGAPVASPDAASADKHP
jgi:AraC-like DNA-binding protein